ncbi:MAG: glycosyltransferase [Xanthomonadales bacterium]|nr:glycosyltransferase [Xanthomonadales bacterium]
MRVLIDGNSMVLRTGATHLSGIGRSTLELCKAIEALRPADPCITLLTQTFRGVVPADFAHIRLKNLLWPIGSTFDRVRGGLPILETMARHDLLHIPHNLGPMYRPQRTVLTIHDAIFFSHPEARLGHQALRELMPGAAQACRLIATPSESAKRDIVEYLGVRPERVIVIPWESMPHDSVLTTSLLLLHA